MFTKIKLLIPTVILFLVAFFSCNREEFLTNPSKVTPSSLDVDAYLNNVQLALPNFVEFLGQFGRVLTRMEGLSAGQTYDVAISSSSLNDPWRLAYATRTSSGDLTGSMLNSINTASTIALSKSYFRHYAILQTINAYVLMSLVDFFGDIPYSEALNSNNLNPKVDKGSDVYKKALESLNNALNAFTLTSVANPTNDMYYANDTAAWKRLVRSLKLKYFVQTRLVNTSAKDSINLLIANPSLLISSRSQDFQFQYGKTTTAPDSRHPLYASSYKAIGVGAGVGDITSGYIGTYALKLFTNTSPSKDPRHHFILYRQTTVSASATSDNLPCKSSTKPTHFGVDDPFCYYGEYWGRDHLDNGGIPPDGLLRTAYGLYPVGGLFDNNAPAKVALGAGSGGNGICPILTSSFVKFYRAEAALTLNTNDVASVSTLLTGGMDDFSNKLLNFSSLIGYIGKVDTSSAAIKSTGYATLYAKYKSDILSLFNSSNDQEKMNILMKEFYKSSWTNGIEVYNNYRRTSYPNDFQPGRSSNSGNLPRSLWYPLEVVTYNINITQKTNMNVKVFWDTNSADLK